MFTGLVEEVGRVERVTDASGLRRLVIGARRVLEDAGVGDSIAVSGCCLTMTSVESERFAVEAVPETLARTTIATWREGDPVNLERAVRAEQRLGGHLVQGHVDGVARVTRVASEGEGRRVTLDLPPSLARFVAEKGSITVDGVSLTVAACDGASVQIAYIPHTLAVTTAGGYRAGDPVHIEVDLIARYVARLLDPALAQERT